MLGQVFYTTQKLMQWNFGHFTHQVELLLSLIVIQKTNKIKPMCGFMDKLISIPVKCLAIQKV